MIRCPSWAVALAALLGAAGQAQTPPLPAGPTSAFEEVVAHVREGFYDPTMGGLDWEAAVARHRPESEQAATPEARAAAVNALLAELQASHTRLYTPEEPAYFELLDLFSEVLPVGRVFPDGRVRYTGIGISSREIDGRTFVADVLEGAPAARAGLLAGDEVLTAGGERFHPIRSFGGKAGNTVRLEIRRTPEPAGRLVLEVVPEEIEPDALYLSSLRASARVVEREGRRVAYVHLRSYAGEAFHQALVELVTGDGPLASADALVLDLRGGWGGASPDYLDLFNAEIPRLTMVARDGSRTQLDARWRKPVVLLVDGTTRSGKEVMAYGFKRYGIGPVVGERTAGAVLAGRPYLLADGSLLFLAVADVLVDGERLEGRGVEPDVRVERSLPYAQGADPPLAKALELAATLAQR